MNTKIVAATVILLSLVTSTYAIDHPAVVQKTIQLNNFNNLRVNDDITVILNNATVPSVIVEGTEKAVASVNCKIDGNTLTIDRKGSRKEKVVVYVSSQNFQDVEASGDTKVSCTEKLNTNALKVIVKDHAEVNVKSTAPIIDAYVFQQGIIRVVGDYTSSSSFISQYNALVGKYTRNYGVELASVLMKK